MTQNGRSYFPHVEGLRGVAAFYVFLFHLHEKAIFQSSPLLWLGPWTSVLQGGHYAVSIFIVVSGYCLGLPVARALDSKFDALAFAKRRFRRLYPAYAVALLLALPIFYLDAATLLHHRPPLAHVAVGIVAHLLMVHNLSKQTIVYISAPMWSIALEVQIYFVFALALIPVWKRFGALAQLGLAIVLSLLPHFLLHGRFDWTCPWLLGLFAMGVWAAAETVRGPQPKVPWTWVAGGVTLLAILLAATHPDYELVSRDTENWIIPDLVVGAAVSLVFVASSVSAAWLPTRILGSKPLQFLGTFSYSLYLVHATVLGLVWSVLVRTHASASVWMVTWIVTIPATLIVAYALYMVAERPFLSRAFRVSLENAHVAPRAVESEALAT